MHQLSVVITLVLLNSLALAASAADKNSDRSATSVRASRGDKVFAPVNPFPYWPSGGWGKSATPRILNRSLWDG